MKFLIQQYFAGLVLVLSAAVWGAYGAGSGDGLSEAEAILINSIDAYQTLVDTSTDWGKYFKLTQNIDFGGTTIKPVGGSGEGLFSGTFDGGGHILSNIIIDSITDNNAHIALFGKVGATSIIKDLTGSNITVTGQTKESKSSYCAILIGESVYGSSVSNCHVSGTVTHTHDIASTYGCAGLLIGANHGSALNCTATGKIFFSATKGTTSSVGGLVGNQTGGPAVGQRSSLENCTAHAAIISAGEGSTVVTRVGGIVGLSPAAGGNSHIIRNCHFKGSISYTAIHHIGLGGVIGESNATLSDCSAMGTIRVMHNGTLGQVIVGGVAGVAYSPISSSFSEIDYRIYYNDVAVIVGGITGQCVTANASIKDCYAKGSFYDLKEKSSKVNFDYCGGICGYTALNATPIRHCFAAFDSYSAKSLEKHISGVLGDGSAAVITDCYWDKTTSTIIKANTPASGKTTAELQAASTFDSWDFAPEGQEGTPAVWMIHPGFDYPRLKWQPLIPGDIAGQYDVVDLIDLHILINHWLQSCHGDCGGADIDNSGLVDLTDQTVLATHWSPKTYFPDIVLDGQINVEDLWALSDQWLGTPGTPSADIFPSGGEGIVNMFDLGALAQYWLKNTGQYKPYDIVPDRQINIEDLWAMANQWLGVPRIPSADIFPPGGDGVVNLLDFTVLAEHWLEGF